MAASALGACADDDNQIQKHSGFGGISASAVYFVAHVCRVSELCRVSAELKTKKHCFCSAFLCIRRFDKPGFVFQSSNTETTSSSSISPFSVKPNSVYSFLAFSLSGS